MRVIFSSISQDAARWARARASAEHGFTMVIALGVLLVTSLLLTADVLRGVGRDPHRYRQPRVQARVRRRGRRRPGVPLPDEPEPELLGDVREQHANHAGDRAGVVRRRVVHVPADLRQRQHRLHQQRDQLAGRQHNRHDSHRVHRIGRDAACRPACDRGELPDGQPARLPLVHALRVRRRRDPGGSPSYSDCGVFYRNSRELATATSCGSRQTR